MLILTDAESGIDLTVTRSTFFRNFCAYETAGLLVTDAWPLVANMVANIFMHSDAALAVADTYVWDPPVTLPPTRLSGNVS